MKVDVRYRPAYALAMITLDAREKTQVEAGAMVGMSADMEMETGASGYDLEQDPIGHFLHIEVVGER